MVYTTILWRIYFNIEYGWYSVLSVFRSCGNSHLWLPQVRKWSGKKFFKLREKSGNFTSSQGKFNSLKVVREK